MALRASRCHLARIDRKKVCLTPLVLVGIPHEAHHGDDSNISLSYSHGFFSRHTDTILASCCLLPRPSRAGSSERLDLSKTPLFGIKIHSCRIHLAPVSSSSCGHASPSHTRSALVSRPSMSSRTIPGSSRVRRTVIPQPSRIFDTLGAEYNSFLKINIFLSGKRHHTIEIYSRQQNYTKNLQRKIYSRSMVSHVTVQPFFAKSGAVESSLLP